MVMADRDKCTGCGSCIVVCPHDQRTRLDGSDEGEISMMASTFNNETEESTR
ncbi:4Fe-4S binding protein [Aromatoleum anaerobium]|uniref:4Fe-4S binding protein n=1 Tax=Aromatoleum anaerobium TaxID=182180 RepID=UPI0031BB598B